MVSICAESEKRKSDKALFANRGSTEVSCAASLPVSRWGDVIRRSQTVRMRSTIRSMGEPEPLLRTRL